MIKVEESKCGVATLKYNNRYIHSKYDPIKESKILVDKYEYLVKENIILVYGLGLGYHIEEISNRNPNACIYVFEGRNDVIDICKRNNDKLSNTKNIKIISKRDKNFYNIFTKIIDKVKEVIVHKPSLEMIKDIDNKLYSVINNYNISKESVDYSGLLKKNYIENLKVCFNNIDILLDKFRIINKPVIVISAGPSLDDELKLVKENREKFIIISVGTALHALMKNNIKPDIIVIIDGKEAVAKQLKDFKNEQIPLCFLSTASRWAVATYNGPKYMFYNRKEEHKTVIETGKTVAVAAMSIALNCNAMEIILLGQDLGYLNGKSHTNTYSSIYGHKDNPTINKYNKFVKGINGDIIHTTSGYIYFKEQIERLIDINKDVKFINCSKGAFINGATHMEFKNYIKNEQNKNC